MGQVFAPPLATRMGRIDVFLTPIDQRVTQSFEQIIHNIRVVNPKIVLPMHDNSEETVEGILSAANKFFAVGRQ